MKRTMRYIAVAALALVGTAMMSCSENDFSGNSPKGKPVTLTTTISLDGSGTRALDADGKKTFAKGEQIALIYESEKNGAQKAVATLEETDIFNEGKSATLTFNLEKAPKKEGDFAMIYPASMAIESIPDGGEFGDCASPNYALLRKQSGKLDSLSTKLDLATCEETFTENATLPGSISLANKLAILEFTDITDYKGNDLTSKITELEIIVDDNTYYYIERTAADGPIYMAIPSCSDSKIHFYTKIGVTEYVKNISSKTLAASTMTPVKLKMQKFVELGEISTEYEAQDGDFLSGVLNAGKITIAAGATVTLGNAEINPEGLSSGSYAGITCEGNATIILEGKNIVKAFADDYPGIQAVSNSSEADYTLTIQGDGKLEVKGGYGSAGIGGNQNVSCGNINIKGGTITATGGDNGAGIGSGYGGKCGNIKIEGGNIKATGGQGAAGIGSGYGGKCGKITMSGGTIEEAKGGGYYAAGIGCGDAVAASCNGITISGGTIKEATGGQGAAGIGTGATNKCGNIHIEGGTIEIAQGGDRAAGIGCGESNMAKCGDITISGGTIKAKGGDDGTGIGTGFMGTCGAITITNGVTNVTATKGLSSPNSIGKGRSGFCGIIKFGTASVYSGDDTSKTPQILGAWTPATMVAGNYGGLTLTISTTTNDNDTWTLTPTSN